MKGSDIKQYLEDNGIKQSFVAEKTGIPAPVYGDIGYMQVNPKWHSDRMDKLGVTDLYDGYSNILVGTDYLYIWKVQESQTPYISLEREFVSSQRYGNLPSKNQNLIYTDGMRIRGCG